MPFRRPGRKSLTLLAPLLAWVAVGVAAPPAPERAGKEAGSGQPFVGALLIDATGSPYRDPARLARMVEELRRTPFAEIILQVRAYGDAHYNSKLVPKALGVSEKFDPLAEFLAALKKSPDAARPRRVFAWINPLRVANVTRAVPVAKEHVSVAHADWLTRNSKFKTADEQGNQYLEPGLEEVRRHLAAVVEELVRQYDLAGIVIDGMAYPGLASDWGYHPQVLDQWRKATGQADQPAPDNPVWREMRRENLTLTLKAMAQAARRARPGLVVAVMGLCEGRAPATPEEFSATAVDSGALQDWPLWLKEKAVDRIILENYRAEGQDAREFDAWNEFAARCARAGGGEVMVAVAGSRNISLDVLTQIRRVHRAGFMGAALSNYRDPVQDASSRDLFFRALGNTEFSSSSQRLPFAPPGEVAATAKPTFPSTPAAPTAEKNPAPTPKEPRAPARPPVELPPPPRVEPADGRIVSAETAPTPGVKPEPTPKPVGELDRLVAEAETRLKRRPEALMEPSEAAREYLKKKFPNIF